ncbi:MAG: LytTR family DNA-binding domain-containing protein [Lentihominibacter sp.]|jgi:two-component system response regulator LytT
MKVSVELSKDFSPPYAIIYADVITEKIQRMIDLLGTDDTPLTAQQEDRIVVIRPDEVYMIRVESGETVIYTEAEKYYSRRRLYEILDQLGGGFMQISKQTVINLSCIKSVEAGFSGTLLLKLKNGASDYVSRKYLPEFKKYLGI